MLRRQRPGVDVNSRFSPRPDVFHAAFLRPASFLLRLCRCVQLLSLLIPLSFTDHRRRLCLILKMKRRMKLLVLIHFTTSATSFPVERSRERRTSSTNSKKYVVAFVVDDLRVDFVLFVCYPVINQNPDGVWPRPEEVGRQLGGIGVIPHVTGGLTVLVKGGRHAWCRRSLRRTTRREILGHGGRAWTHFYLINMKIDLDFDTTTTRIYQVREALTSTQPIIETSSAVLQCKCVC